MEPTKKLGGGGDRQRVAAATIVVLSALPLCALAWFAGDWAGRAARPEQPSSNDDGALRCPSDRLAFGSAWEDQHFVWTLPIENHGSQNVAIKDFANTCTCVSIEPRALTIPAGETREVRVTLDLRATGKDYRFDLAPFRFTGEIVPLARGGRSAGGRWKLRGEVRPAARLSQTLLDFGQRSERAKPWESRRVKVAVADGVAVTTSCPNPYFQARIDPDKRGRQELVVAPRGDTPGGDYSFDILVTPKSAQGETLTAQRLAVRGSVVGDVQASARQVLFGAHAIGEIAEESLTLSSLTGQAFEVTGTKASLEGLQVKPAANVSTTTGPVYQLRQTIATVGEQAGAVTFEYCLADGHRATLVVPVSYLGRSAP